MSPVCTGKRRRLDCWFGMPGRLHPHIYALAAEQLDTLPSMGSAPPISPEKGLAGRKRLHPRGQCRSSTERRQDSTHPARLFGGRPMPLTLLTQWTGTAMANAGCIHHTQGPIALWAAFLGVERMVGRTAQRSIRLGGKVMTF